MKHFQVSTGDPEYMDTGGEMYLVLSQHDRVELAERNADKRAKAEPGRTFYVERLPFTGPRVWSRIGAYNASTDQQHQIVKDIISGVIARTEQMDRGRVRASDVTSNAYNGVDIRTEGWHVVRIAMEDIEAGVEIYGLDGHGVMEWSARFTLSAPISGIVATVVAAL